jgi:hypothetical protein
MLTHTENKMPTTFYTMKSLVEMGVISQAQREFHSLYCETMRASEGLHDAKPHELISFSRKDIEWLIENKLKMESIMSRIENFLDDNEVEEEMFGETYLKHPDIDSDVVWEFASCWECDKNGEPKIFNAFKSICGFMA